MIERYLNLRTMRDKSSHFLLGARGTGNSYLIRETLSNLDASYIDLLESRVFLRLQNDPHEIEYLGAKDLVVIDEIQRIPELIAYAAVFPWNTTATSSLIFSRRGSCPSRAFFQSIIEIQT